MKDEDVNKYLSEHFSGSQPRDAFKQQVLRDSQAELVRVWRRRSARLRAELAAAAILIAGVGFLGGRLSAPLPLPRNVDVAPQAAAEPDSVTVPSDLVAWLDAARLFGQLGMEDRMARAVERAGRLLPSNALIADGRAERVFAAGAIRNQTGREEPIGIGDPNISPESINRILAQTFGD